MRRSILAIAALALGTGVAVADGARTPVYPAGNVPIAPYSPGIVTANGFLYVSGQIAYVDGAIPEHARDGEDDVAEQATIVMENLRGVLDTT